MKTLKATKWFMGRKEQPTVLLPQGVECLVEQLLFAPETNPALSQGSTLLTLLTEASRARCIYTDRDVVDGGSSWLLSHCPKQGWWDHKALKGDEMWG